MFRSFWKFAKKPMKNMFKSLQKFPKISMKNMS